MRKWSFAGLFESDTSAGSERGGAQVQVLATLAACCLAAACSDSSSIPISQGVQNAPTPAAPAPMAPTPEMTSDTAAPAPVDHVPESAGVSDGIPLAEGAAPVADPTDGVAASGVPDAGSPADAGAPSDGELASSFRCGNWADGRDNFVDGDLLLSGLAGANTYEAVVATSDRIVAEFQRTANVNALRIPINEPTVLGDAWQTYKGAIDAAVARQVRVIITYWAWHDGKYDDADRFNQMWDRVIDTYANNGLVYFEAINEPWAYSDVEPIIQIEAQWLDRHANVPRGRMVIAGSWSDQEVRVQGVDPRLDGTLLSIHIYPFSSAMRTATQEWKDALDYNLGGHGNRVIVTEWGAPMTRGADYSGPGDGDHNASFITGISEYLQANDIGSCYWPLLRTGDSWSITTLGADAANPTLNVTNASGLARISAGFRLTP